jgi:hypothetical protein
LFPNQKQDISKQKKIQIERHRSYFIELRPKDQLKSSYMMQYC